VPTYPTRSKRKAPPSGGASFTYRNELAALALLAALLATLFGTVGLLLLLLARLLLAAALLLSGMLTRLIALLLLARFLIGVLILTHYAILQTLLAFVTRR
jgi:hypothetical protein